MYSIQSVKKILAKIPGIYAERRLKVVDFTIRREGPNHPWKVTHVANPRTSTSFSTLEKALVYITERDEQITLPQDID